MKITLAKIKKHHPCHDGWQKILAAQGPDLDREWSLVEAFKSNGLEDVLWALRCLPEHSNLWRKYAVWCVMQVDHLLPDQRSMDALDVAWTHSNGMATDAELAAASDAAIAAADAQSAAAWAAAWAAARAAAVASSIDAARAAAESARYAAWAASDAAGAAAGAAAIDAASAARAAAKAAQEKN